jgi:hypothetical protein
LVPHRGRIDHDDFSIGLLLAAGIFLMLAGMKYRVDLRGGNHARPNNELKTAAFFFIGIAALFLVLAVIVSGTYVLLGGTSLGVKPRRRCPQPVGPRGRGYSRPYRTLGSG